MQKYKWIVKANPKQDSIETLCKELKINKELAIVLLHRAVTNFAEAKQFFRPDASQLHNPFLMKDMDLAANRLAKAIKEEQKILVYGDYDVDGTTSVAMMSSFLRKFHDNIDSYIPNRYDEGYGVSQKGIDYAIDNDFDLLITLDCGIKAVEKLTIAQNSGLDVIVCDHHEAGEQLPKVLAVLDPKRKDCNYPFKELSGCGVGFKLIQACLETMAYDKEIAFEFLDLLCLSISADLVSMMGENRVLAFLGLETINNNPRFGIDAMLNDQKKGRTTISDLVFGVAPKINAAGRITHAKHALNLLNASSKEEAENLLKEVVSQNETRKTLDEKTLIEALQMIEDESCFSNVLYNADWNKGILGIVASRVIEKSYKPTLVFTKSAEGLLVGSARSVKDFDLYESLEMCEDYIDEFGGHKFAAGLKVREEKLKDFRQRFEEVVRSKIHPSQRIPSLDVDCMIDLESIDDKFVRILQQMGPFGPGNLNPLFCSENLVLASEPSQLGADKSHLRFEVKTKNGSTVFQTIAFGMGKRMEELRNPFKMVYSVKINYWNNRSTVQLEVEDFCTE